MENPSPLQRTIPLHPVCLEHVTFPFRPLNLSHLTKPNPSWLAVDQPHISCQHDIIQDLVMSMYMLTLFSCIQTCAMQCLFA